MAQNKEQLNKLLLFIKKLVEEPGNEEFVEGLRKLVGVPIRSSGNETKLNDIEKYLGLDYKLDSATPDIDFSFVKEESIKEQLSADYREMLRYRYGVRSHKIDFLEFCRYAMLQVEQLLNYYYQNKFSNNDDLIAYINENAPWANLAKIDNVKALSLAVKLSAFSKNIKKRFSDSLDFAREIRNEQSHRSTKEDINNITIFRKQLINMGLPLTRDGEVIWTSIMDDCQLLAKYNSIDKNKYWKYRYQLWRLREPFKDVSDAINETAMQIKKELEAN
jgi:hypothetical protein